MVFDRPRLQNRFVAGWNVRHDSEVHNFSSANEGRDKRREREREGSLKESRPTRARSYPVKVSDHKKQNLLKTQIPRKEREQRDTDGEWSLRCEHGIPKTRKYPKYPEIFKDRNIQKTQQIDTIFTGVVIFDL